MPAHVGTGERPRCGTCIGSSGRRNNRGLSRRCGREKPRPSHQPSASNRSGRAHDRAQSRAHPETANTPPVAAAVRDAEPVKPYWYAPYMALRQDWNTFIEGARQAGILIFYAKGYADMIPRIRALAENPDVPAVTRAPMMQVLENHQRYLSTRKHIDDYLDQVDRHIEEHDSMESLAEELDMKVAEISDYPDWRRENDHLTTAGEAILSDMETHGPHLDHILIGETRMKWALLNMSRRHPPRRRGHQRGSHRGRKAACPAGNVRGAGAAGRTGGSQIPSAPVGCGRCSHTRGARGGAKGIRRLCGAPLRKVRFAQRRGARGPLNIQELEHPPVTATRLATSAPFPVTSWHGCRQSPNR